MIEQLDDFSAQLSLELEDFYTASTVSGVGATITERFESFHTQNPHVYKAIVLLARKLVRRGQTRLSMKCIYEFLRMKKMLYTTDSKFKLNNDYTSMYARLIDEQERDLENRFEFRERRAA